MCSCDGNDVNEARAGGGWVRASIDISPETVSVKAKMVAKLLRETGFYSHCSGSCSCHTFHALLGLVGSLLPFAAPESGSTLSPISISC
jgi:hypothetical protein